MLLSLAAATLSSADGTVSVAMGAGANQTQGECYACQISANQVAKNPRPVELLGRGKGKMMGMSESEWEDRLALAALGLPVTPPTHQPLTMQKKSLVNQTSIHALSK